jgi:hypothetical protein
MTVCRAREKVEMTAVRHFLWLEGKENSHMKPKERKLRPDDPDLHTQLESLLDEVWRCESTWRLDDRIALAVKVDNAGRHTA